MPQRQPEALPVRRDMVRTLRAMGEASVPMAGDGSLSRDTHVWTPGQDGWLRAGDVRELAQLFTVMPPPPPPAG